jgi:hypothetical protein
MSYINADTSFENESAGAPITVLAPLTGTTITLKSITRDLYIQGTLAALTINLPQVASGQSVNIYFAGAVTALSITDRFGVVVATAPAAATAGQSIQMRMIPKFLGATIGWVRWR